jgi:sugar phosphate isomerase/epimerase
VNRPVAVMTDVLPSRDDAELFRHARQIGFAGVEVILPAQLESLRAAQAESGLAVPSLVLGEHSDRGGVADHDPAVASAAADDVRQALRWAEELGADALLVPFFGRAELRDGADIARAARSLRPFCDGAVQVLYEGTLPAEGIRDLAAQVGSPQFGCYFDVANVVVRGMDSAIELRALGDLVRRVHVKDVRTKVNDCAPGLGFVDFAATARALDDIGYLGWIVLETPPGPPELVARDLSYVRSVIPGLSPDVTWPRVGVFARQLDEWDTVLELGVDVVQLGEELLDVEHAEALAAAGIGVAGVAGYRNLIAPDERERRENLAYLEHCLQLAPQLGTRVVATESGTRNRESEWADAPENVSPATFALFEESIARLVDVAERAGSILALEGMVRHVLRNQSALARILDTFPSRHLQVLLDPYNFMSRHLLREQARVTQAFLDRFEHRFVLAHGKDVGPGGAEEATPAFGTGVFDQAPYLRFLRDRRPDLPVILEHLPLADVPRTVELVRA